MRRFIIVVVFPAAIVVVSGSATHASHGAPYSVNVRHARAYARAHVNVGQWTCLRVLWHEESGWSVHARTGRAYGIPQALPGRRMRSAGRDWRTSGTTQVRWGLNYVRGRYGTPCHALTFQGRNGWY